MLDENTSWKDHIKTIKKTTHKILVYYIMQNHVLMKSTLSHIFHILTHF